MAEGFERHVRVLHGSLGHPKFIGLTAAERGTWLVALILADIAHPAPIHEAAVLEKCPDASFERLYERELIEQDERPGWFHVHDLRQFHVTPSSTPEAVRERVARHRAKQDQKRTVTDVTAVTDVTTDDTIRNDTKKNGREGRIGRTAGAIEDREAERTSRPIKVRGFRTAVET